MKTDLTLIGQRIKNKRKEMGISQMDFAEKINRSTTFVSYIETGCRSMTIDTLIDIANVLEVSADYLLVDYLCEPASEVDQEIIMLLSDCIEVEREFLVGCLKAIKKSYREEGFKITIR